MKVERSDNLTKGTSWLAWFDLLGFKQKTSIYADRRYANAIDGLSVLAGDYIEKALDAIEEVLSCQKRFQRAPLYHAYFSDTFILYAPGDSRDSFLTIDSAAGTFFTKMVYANMPLRGALTWGRFYADRPREILMGPALIEAHEYAEKQDWIGYVLTPQAVERLSKMEPPIMLPCCTYAEGEVPVKTKGSSLGDNKGERLRFAFRISQYLDTARCIHQMMKETRNEAKEAAEKESRRAGKELTEARNEWREIYKRCRSKYINTLLFMKHTALRSE